MFRTAELGRTIEKEQYHQVLPTLRAELLEVQQQLRDAPFPVIVVFAGVDGAGKAQTVNQLNEWLDARWLITRAFGSPSDEEAERPEYWRYWRDLPPKGRVGLFLRSWYSPPLLDRVYERTSEAEFDEALDRVIAFERGLADDGALIVKFWMHLGKKAQKQRLRALEKDPLTRWRITQTAWDHWHMYDQFVVAAERTITRTSTGHAPWHIVEGYDKRYRSLTVGSTILEAILAVPYSDEKRRARTAKELEEVTNPTPIERELRCTAATIPTKKLSSEPTSRKAKSISVEDALPSWLLRAARCRCYRVVFLRASVHQKDRICLTTRNTNLTRSTHRSCRSCNYPPQLSPNTTKPSSPSPISPLNTQTKSISPLPSTIASSK